MRHRRAVSLHGGFRLNLGDKLTQLKQHLSHLQKVAVAFSGGVDSTLLLKVACDTLGRDRVVALTACTQLVPRQEQLEARELAEKLGIHHVRIHEDVLQVENVASNPRDRCYHCKHEIFSLFLERCQDLGFEHLVDGTNLDDLGEDRPGLKALAELNVGSPLAECRLGKEEVRALSRTFGLPTAERPSFACLASRIPFGVRLTAENLAQVERCEEGLRELGFGNFRVRHHGSVARIEVERPDMQRLMDSGIYSKVIKHFKAQGFHYVTLDLEGLRSGSMSEVDP